jgi:hypothetical protein
MHGQNNLLEVELCSGVENQKKNLTASELLWKTTPSYQTTAQLG